MRIVIGSSHWLLFAAVAVAVSYALRLLAWVGTRAGSRRLARAREALGLPPLNAGDSAATSQRARGTARQ